METNRKFCDVDAEPMTSGDKVPTIYGPLWEGSGMTAWSQAPLVTLTKVLTLTDTVSCEGRGPGRLP